MSTTIAMLNYIFTPRMAKDDITSRIGFKETWITVVMTTGAVACGKLICWNGNVGALELQFTGQPSTNFVNPAFIVSISLSDTEVKI